MYNKFQNGKAFNADEQRGIERFRRIKEEHVEIDPRVKDNSFDAKVSVSLKINEKGKKGKLHKNSTFRPIGVFNLLLGIDLRTHLLLLNFFNTHTKLYMCSFVTKFSYFFLFSFD